MVLKQDVEAVRYFLKICKKEVKKGNCYFVGNRIINMNGKFISAKQALLDIGIMNQKQIWEYILELKEEDCIKIDFDYDMRRDTNCEIFVFKKKINRHLVYIKLTMRSSGIICISFHKDY